MAKGSDQSRKPEPAEDMLAEMHKEGFRNIAQFNAVLMERFAEMNAEMAKFIARRIAEDVKVQQELLRCKDLKDVQNVQVHFFEQAFKQYQEGSARMIDIGTHALEDLTSK
jgi:hypothetical protein